MTNKELQEELKKYPDTHDVALIVQHPQTPNIFIAGKLQIVHVTRGTMIFLRGIGQITGENAPPL